MIRRAAACFDKVWVCVSPNAEKKNQLFTPEPKLRLVQAAVADLPNVEAELFPGLLADYAVDHGANVIVRGVRNATDFDVEYQRASTPSWRPCCCLPVRNISISVPPWSGK